MAGGAAVAGSLAGRGLPAAEALSLPPNNAPPNTRTFYPEDYGALGNLVNDDTDAIQACIDACNAAGGGTVQFGPKPYLVNGGSAGGPRHDRGGNAILALPVNDQYTQTTTRLAGVERATTIVTTRAGLGYSSTYGCPSIIGGPTYERSGVNAYSYANVEIQDLNVLAPANPSICGIDLSRLVRSNVERVVISTNDPAGSAPTHTHSFGLRITDGLNFGRVRAELVDVSGYFTGVVTQSAHVNLNHVIVKWCMVGVGLLGSGQYAHIDPHPAYFEALSTEWCVVHIGGWRPDGAIPLAGPFSVDMRAWDIEDGLPGNWFTTFVHIADSDDYLTGVATYVRVLAGVGVSEDPPAVVGAPNLSLTNLSPIAPAPLSARQSAQVGQGEPPRLVKHVLDPVDLPNHGPLPRAKVKQRAKAQAQRLLSRQL